MSKSIAQQLRDCIRRDGRSLYAIAQAAGADSSVLIRFVNGDRTITLDTAGPICEALDLELRPKRRTKGR